MSLNPLDYPIVFSIPRRLTPISAWHEHIPFAMCLVDLLKPATVVELGTHYGDSYCAFCQAVLELNLSTRCYAIDTWEGDPHSGLYGPEVLARLREHHDPLYGSFSSLVKTTFDDALAYFSDGTIDLLHIDGYHTYEAVKHDFESWLPKMSVRGVVLFHDINVRERNFGVWKLWEETTEKHPYFEFVHGHGLGVLAVGKDFPTAFQEFLEASLEAAANIRRFFFQLGQRLTFEVQQRNLSQEAAQLQLAQQQALAEKEEHANRIAEDRDRLARDVTELQSSLGSQQQALAKKEEHANRMAEDRDRLARVVTGLQSSLSSQQQALVEKDQQVNRLAEDRDRQAREVSELQSAVSSQQQALVEREQQVNRLAEDRDRQARDLAKLQDVVQSQRQALAEKEEETKRLAVGQERLGRETGELQAAIQNSQKELSDKEVRIASMHELIQQREAVLSEIYSSHGWKALTAYYELRNKALPEGTKRRELAKYLWECLWKTLLSTHAGPRGAAVIARHSPTVFTWRNLGRTLRHAKTFGFAGAYQKVKEKLAHSGYTFQSTGSTTVAPVTIKPVVIKGEDVAKEEVTVSVVIPTKDGGEDFRRIVAMIAKQTGFREVEIIVVDSGSTDKTVELAEQFGAKVIKILPEEFTHSYARNLGARHATGQYLLFTVQDALPPSDSWLRELFNVIKNNRVVAVSCAEFPAESADLFYRAISWNHYRFLEVDNNDRLLSKGSAEDHISLRKNGQLSDLACLISKDVFAEYEYKTDYGEDLDLGLRLIRNGHAIAFLGSTRIIHSHNRPAYYYLRRAYVENLFVPKILPDYPVLSRNFDRIVSDIALTSQAISSLVAEGAWELQLPCRTIDFSCGLLRKFEEVLKARSPFPTRIINNSFSDVEFEAFLTRIMNEHCMAVDSAEGILGEAVMNFTRMVLAYMEQTYDFIDDHVAEDFRSSLYKAFAYQCGAQLAGCFLKHSGSGNAQVEQIHMELSKGV